MPAGKRKEIITQKQDKFCLQVASMSSGEVKNLSDAYRNAYDCSRMSPKSVNEAASKLFKMPKIKARIAEIQRPVFKRFEASAKKTISRLMHGQEFDIRELYHQDGTLKMPHELSDEAAKAVIGAKHDKEGTLIEYKIIDVKGCSELIGKYLKMWTDDEGRDVAVNVTVMPKITIKGKTFNPKIGKKIDRD